MTTTRCSGLTFSSRWEHVERFLVGDADAVLLNLRPVEAVGDLGSQELPVALKSPVDNRAAPLRIRGPGTNAALFMVWAFSTFLRTSRALRAALSLVALLAVPLGLERGDDPSLDRSPQTGSQDVAC